MDKQKSGGKAPQNTAHPSPKHASNVGANRIKGGVQPSPTRSGAQMPKPMKSGSKGPGC